MIPDSILENNPVMGKFSKEIADKNICRICLLETDQKSIQRWNTLLRTCFSSTPVIDEKLPKYVCQQCSEFLDKCAQFKKMYRKSELILLSYPLTGTLPSRVEVPSWLRPVQKRKREAVRETTSKSVCSENSTGTNRVPSSELCPVKATLQSPTITSEITSPQKETQCAMNPPSTIDELLQQSRAPTPSRSTVIQQMQTYVETYQNSVQSTQQYQYRSSQIFVPSTQQPFNYPILQQQLQQPLLPIPINPQVAIPLNQQTQQIVPQQTQLQQQPHHQQASQQPTPTLKPPQQPPAYQTSAKPKPPTSQQPATPTTFASPSTASAVAVIQCNVCSYLFASQHHLMAHMRKHLGNGEYRCPCGRHFRHMRAYVQHLKQHSTIAWCDLCGVQFPEGGWSLGAHLDQHVRTGLAEACDFCPLVFIDLEGRLAHVRSKHEKELRYLMELNQCKYRDDGTWV